jgi:SEC-C motif
VPETPRNAPCPCGSGAKYKKCCMPQQVVPVFPAQPAAPSMLVPFRKADRERAYEQLLEFASRTEFRASFAAAQETFGGAHMEAPGTSMTTTIAGARSATAS